MWGERERLLDHGEVACIGGEEAFLLFFALNMCQ